MFFKFFLDNYNQNILKFIKQKKIKKIFQFDRVMNILVKIHRN
jgi:hypothetical protein